MAWIVRLVKTEADGEKQSVDVVTINRPDDLIEIANLGLSLAEGKRLLAGVQQEIVRADAFRRRFLIRSALALSG